MTHVPVTWIAVVARRRTVNLTLRWVVSSLALAGLIAAPAVAGAPASRAEITFAPHRAVYDLTLDEAKTSSGVTGVTGRIVYELTGSVCEGYTQTMRFVKVTSSESGEAQTTDLRTSSWEEFPARRLRFSTTSYENEMLAEQTQGIAERSEPGGPAIVNIKRPEKKKAALAANVYFPIQHSMAVVKAAREGKTMVIADLFDGSDAGGKVYSTTTAIGRAYKPGGGPKLTLSSGSGTLDAVPSRPIAVSYFTAGETRGDTLPLYEMSYRFHDNGVTSGLRIDYGDYSITGELKELTYLEAATCK